MDDFLSLSDSLEEVKRLQLKGRYSEALQILANYWSTLREDQRLERTECLNQESQCLWCTTRLAEAEIRARKALELAQQNPPYLSGQGDAFHNLGAIFLRQGKLDQAEQSYQRSLSLRQKIGTPDPIAHTLNNLGLVYWRTSKLDKAEDLFRESLSLWQKLNNPQMVARSLGNLGNVYFHRGMIRKSKEYLERSLVLFEETGNPQGLALTLLNLGNICAQRGELERAEESLQRSRKLFDKIGNPRQKSIALINLGIVHFKKGELDQAEKDFKQSLALREEIGDLQAIASTRYQLLRLLVAKGSLEEATEQIDEIAQSVDNTQLPDVEVMFHLSVGLLKSKQHELTTALNHSSQAKKQAGEIPHFALLVDASYLLVQNLLQLYLLTKENEYKIQVESLLSELESLCKREQLHDTFVETTLMQGFLKRAMFDLPEAIEAFERAELLAQEQGILPLTQKARRELIHTQDQIEMLQRLRELSPKAYEKAQIDGLLSYLHEIHDSR